MRLLLVGGSGMLGTDFREAAGTRGIALVAPSRTKLDITRPESVAAIATGTFGDLDAVVNCAAYTAVDRAETEQDEALALNGLGPGYLARACEMASLKLIHVSTDFVFDGASSSPYTEGHPTNPLGTYGLTKFEGERGVLACCSRATIVRTSWLYGPHGPSFPRTMLRAWRAGKSLRVVADQVGNPTYTADLATTLIEIALKDLEPGIYHATGPESMSWHELAKRTIRAYIEVVGQGEEPHVAPITTEEYPTPARRPQYSVLSNEKLHAAGIPPMRGVDETLRDFVRRLEAVEPELFRA